MTTTTTTTTQLVRLSGLSERGGKPCAMQPVGPTSVASKWVRAKGSRPHPYGRGHSCALQLHRCQGSVAPKWVRANGGSIDGDRFASYFEHVAESVGDQWYNGAPKRLRREWCEIETEIVRLPPMEVGLAGLVTTAAGPSTEYHEQDQGKSLCSPPSKRHPARQPSASVIVSHCS